MIKPKHTIKYRRRSSDSCVKERFKMGDLIIGKGVHGSVYVGLDKHKGGLVAIKSIRINPTLCSSDGISAIDIRNEARLLSALSHENIVKYIDSAINGDEVLIYTEWVPGGSIDQIVANFGELPETVAMSYTEQILNGLQYLHKNDIVHLDIKPANVLISEAGKVKVADFGASKRLLSHEFTVTPVDKHKDRYSHCTGFEVISRRSFNIITENLGNDEGGIIQKVNNSSTNESFQSAEVRLFDNINDSTLSLTDTRAESYSLYDFGIRGTPYYISPEAIRLGVQGKSSDIWSVGCTLLYMLTASPPWKSHFNFDSVPGFLYQVANACSSPPYDENKNSSTINSLLCQCFEINPRKRPSAKQLLEQYYSNHQHRDGKKKSSPRSVQSDFVNVTYNLSDLAPDSYRYFENLELEYLSWVSKMVQKAFLSTAAACSKLSPSSCLNLLTYRLGNRERYSAKSKKHLNQKPTSNLKRIQTHPEVKIIQSKEQNRKTETEVHANPFSTQGKYISENLNGKDIAEEYIQQQVLQDVKCTVDLQDVQLI